MMLKPLKKVTIALAICIAPVFILAQFLDDRALFNAISVTWGGFCGWEIWPRIFRSA